MANYTLSAKLTADAREFIKGIQNARKEMGTLEKFSKSVGSKFTEFGNKIGKIGDGLTNKITKPALVAGTAVAGITLAKGFERLTSIDTAQAKLKALGHDAESVGSIMTSALESVKGTSYGLGEAAMTAANAVAAGVKPGKELTRYLELAGDAAAVAGVDMEEMGSIFNKVQTSNKAYNYELQQLSDRGLPIYQWLADEAGATGEAIFEMASNGEISSEMLLNAVEKNIGGAAKKMGEESFVAGVANIWAAVGRLGAAFLDAGGTGGGFFSIMKKNIPSLIDNLDSLGNKAEEWGVKFGEAILSIVGKIKEIKESYDGLDESTKRIIDKFAIWGSVGAVAIGPILKIVSAISTAIGFLGTTIIPAVTSAFSVIGAVVGAISAPVWITIGVITALAAAFVYAYQESEVFREFVQNAFERVREVVVTVINEVVSVIMDVWGFLVEWWSENSDTIASIAEKAWNNLKTVISAVMEFLEPYITTKWEAIKLITGIVWDAMKTYIMTALEVIGGVISAVLLAIDGDWTGAWNKIKETFFNVLSRMHDLGKSIMDRIKNAIGEKMEKVKEAIKNKITEAKDRFVQGMQNMVSDAVSKGAEIASNVRNKFEEVKQNIQNKIDEAKQRLATGFNNMVTDVKSKASDIVSTVNTKFTEVKNKIMKPIEEAKDKISGYIDDIKGFFTNLKLKIPKPQMPSMPSFSLKTSSKEVFGKTITYPSGIGVSWNAQGGIFDRPTIFNTANAGLQGVGEAGPEAIIPLNSKVLGGIGKGIAATMTRDSQPEENTSEQPKQPVIVNVYDNKEAVRAYVNENNAVEATIRRF